MNRFWIPALVVSAMFSANAFAYRDCDDDVRYERHYRQSERPPVVWGERESVYREAPRVVYRERIVYRERPVYYEQAPARYYEQPEGRYYEQPEGRYYEQSRPYSGYDDRPASYPRYDGNRAVGQAIGAVAGGVIGNQIGRGGGRVAATAVGAVLGSVVGGRLAEYPY